VILLFTAHSEGHGLLAHALSPPVLGDVAEHAMLDLVPLAKTSVPSEAWHAFKDARTFFKWCVPRYIKHSPMEGLKSPTRYTPRKRVLTDAELVTVWRSAEDVGYPFGTVIQLSLLWGTRWGETISCSRAFLDTRERTITLPDTKNGKENCFPYEQMTADILETIPRFNSTDLLFPGKA
jgi:integrase